jgi:transcriptional regulator with XRE-family HTH domain
MTSRDIAQQIATSLDDREYAASFVEAEIVTGLSFQIRALRKERGWTQTDLANETGQYQKTISDFENPNIGPGNITSLLKMAAAFDVGLIVRFAPYSELVDWASNMSRASHFVPSRTKDAKLKLQRNGTHGELPQNESTFVQMKFDLGSTCNGVIVRVSDWLAKQPNLTTSKNTLNRPGDVKRAHANVGR